jgi:prevent-host-death family protein
MLNKSHRDRVSLADFKRDPLKVVNHVKDSYRPVFLTSRRSDIAVIQGLEEYEHSAEQLAFVTALAEGLLDIQQGNTLTLEHAKKCLGV